MTPNAARAALLVPLALWACHHEPVAPTGGCAATVECPVGQYCIDGACQPDPCLSCEEGQVCVALHCLPAACEARACRVGEGCLEGRCVAADCVEVTCPEGQACARGECFPDSCDGVSCAGGVCSNGTCVSAACVEVTCPAGQACVEGACMAADCEGFDCAEGAACIAGRCQEIACVGISCPEGSLCAAGRCVGVRCPGGDCPEGLVCEGERCREPLCIGTQCPAGSYCSGGSCLLCKPSEQACADGIDEDCDGAGDCADTECEGRGCDDWSRCTSGELCQAGSCVGAPAECLAPPNDRCFEEGLCDPYEGCVYPMLTPGAACRTVDPCRIGGTCDDEGQCVGETDLVCQDDDPCTADGCTAGVGCEYPVEPDGTPCGSGSLYCHLGDCEPGCQIDGAYLPADKPSPTNPCERCDPGTSSEAWTPVGAGTSCDQPTTVCKEPQCDGAGACREVDRPDDSSCGPGRICQSGACVNATTFCEIGGQRYSAGTINPADPCESCSPLSSSSSWTPRQDGTGCAGGVCVAGACSGGCWIAGALHAREETNPSDPCEHCDPSASTTGWSPKSEGSSCDSGRVCAAGACTSGCWIAGALVPSWTSNPANPCERCDPAASTAAWSPKRQGASCGSGRYCCSGSCVPMSSGTSCGACGVDCTANGGACQQQVGGGFSCTCSNDAQCRAALGSPYAACWTEELGGPNRCQCQCEQEVPECLGACPDGARCVRGWAEYSCYY